MYNDFYPHTIKDFKSDPRVRFYGKTPKATVLEAVENSHIHGYPSTYPETFCLSQAEAMSAGLICVTSDIGALPEVSNGLTRMYGYEDDLGKHEDLFAEHLTKAIEDIKAGNWNPEEQIKFVNSEYSWERHKERWLELHDKL
jgi:glycosyltransferase involved in cell wall biosynthesis